MEGGIAAQNPLVVPNNDANNTSNEGEAPPPKKPFRGIKRRKCVYRNRRKMNSCTQQYYEQAMVNNNVLEDGAPALVGGVEVEELS